MWEQKAICQGIKRQCFTNCLQKNKRVSCFNVEGLALISRESCDCCVSPPAQLAADPHTFTHPALGDVFLFYYSKWKFHHCWHLVSDFNDIINSFWLQETLEDIDKNGDGHVDEDEYIGTFKQRNEIRCINF